MVSVHAPELAKVESEISVLCWLGWDGIATRPLRISEEYKHLLDFLFKSFDCTIDHQKVSIACESITQPTGLKLTIYLQEIFLSSYLLVTSCVYSILVVPAAARISYYPGNYLLHYK
jgi:hypothetical protein